MCPVLKRDASPEVICTVDQIEKRSDTWFSGMAIGSYPHDLAGWGILTRIVGLIEDSVEKSGFGSQRHRETMMNLARCPPLILERLREQRLPEREFLLRWTGG